MLSRPRALLSAATVLVVTAFVATPAWGAPRRHLKAEKEKSAAPVSATPLAIAAAQAPTPPTEPAPTPRSRAADRIAPAEALSTSSKDVDAAALVIAPRLGMGARWFDYRDRMSTGLRSFEIVGTPVVGADAAVYPGALATASPIAAALGACGSFTNAIGAVATIANTELNVDWTAFDAGACARVPIGNVTVGASLTYGGIDFGFDGRTTPETASASARYRFVRARARVRVPVATSFHVEGVAGGMSPTDLGPLAERFPRAEGAGVVAELGASLQVAQWVELRSRISYERFFFALHPEPGDLAVAGGAHDDQARWDVSAALFY